MVWSSVSQFEVVEGLLVAALTLLAVVVESRKSSSLFSSPLLNRHLKSPLSRLFTVLAAAGALCFALLVVCNLKRINDVIDVGGLDLVQYPLRVLGFFGGSAMGEYGRAGYGALGLLVWGLTVVALSLARGFVSAVKRFAVPSVLFLTVVVLLFDPGEMDIQAVNVVSGITYDGMSLLSNWFLLTVSLSLVVFDLLYGRLQRKGIVHFNGARMQSSGAPVRLVPRKSAEDDVTSDD